MKGPRTALFVPGTEPRKIEKAYACAPDAVVIDLEDAVPEPAKAAARDEAAAAIARFAADDAASWVRINPIGGEHWLADVAAVVRLGLDAILIPMLESPDQVAMLTSEVVALEQRNGVVAEQRVAFVPLVETATGLWQAPLLLQSSERITMAMLGPGDLALDLRARLDRDEAALSIARALFVILARAGGAEHVIDGPYPFLEEPELFEQSTRWGRALGYGGRAVLHPSQKEIAARVYAPTEDEVSWAREVLRVFETATRRGSAAAMTGQGEFVDYAIARRARLVLDAAVRE